MQLKLSRPSADAATCPSTLLQSSTLAQRGRTKGADQADDMHSLDAERQAKSWRVKGQTLAILSMDQALLGCWKPERKAERLNRPQNADLSQALKGAKIDHPSMAWSAGHWIYWFNWLATMMRCVAAFGQGKKIKRSTVANWPDYSTGKQNVMQKLMGLIMKIERGNRRWKLERIMSNSAGR